MISFVGWSMNPIYRLSRRLLILRKFPIDYPFPKLCHDSESVIAELLRAKLVGRVGPQRRTDHCPARRQRPPCPPNVQRRNMPMPNALLPARMRGNPLYR